MIPLEKAQHALRLALPELIYQRRIEFESVLPVGVEVPEISAKDEAWREMVDADVVEYIAQIDAAIVACQDALTNAEDHEGDTA